MDNTAIENRYLDILHNMETAIVQVDKTSKDLTDLEVMDALDDLMRAYTAEASGRNAPFMRLSPLKRQVFDAVKAMCEWRLGRNTLESVGGAPVPAEVNPSPITLDEILICLKRVRLSAKRWNGSNGRRGYLEYIRNFLP